MSNRIFKVALNISSFNELQENDSQFKELNDLPILKIRHEVRLKFT